MKDVSVKFEQIMQTLEELTPYELRRIQDRSYQLSRDESKLQPIRNALQPGMTIKYFNGKLNKEVMAFIEDVRNTKVSVVHVEDGAKWTTGLYSINLENIQTRPASNHKQGTLSKTNLSIGDLVGFEDKGREIIGEVIKLNPKSAKIKLKDGCTWSVYYEYLFPVVDGVSQFQKDLFIEGEVVDAEIVA